MRHPIITLAFAFTSWVAAAQTPVNPNQQLADAVAARLRANPAVSGADLSVTAQEGTVRVVGTVQSGRHSGRDGLGGRHGTGLEWAHRPTRHATATA